MSSPLPPLPTPNYIKAHHMTSEALRARDQEIVRCVLEAVANLCYDRHVVYYVTDAIRALEFHHE